jgi:CPA1 family monovalent cation:H+ antiporter
VRGASVVLPTFLLHRRNPNRWKGVAVLTWGGLRGGISVALALSLPGGGYFDTLRAVAYGVVLLSLVVQGATIHPLSSRLAAETQARR